MTGSIRKADLFASLGYGGGHDLLEQALEEAGLSRPAKTSISPAKAEEVARVLALRFVPVCSRGDCQAEWAAGGVETRTPVPAASGEDCAVCGGSANRRAVDAMVAAVRAAGLSKLCVVGGSPNARTELERLVAGRLELRLVDGSITRNAQQARADLAWADRVAIWGGTILAHKISSLYKGRNVIQLARRSIQELAREVTVSVS